MPQTLLYCLMHRAGVLSTETLRYHHLGDGFIRVFVFGDAIEFNFYDDFDLNL